MKILLAVILALYAVFSAHAASEQLCSTSNNCTCDPSKYNSSVIPPNPTLNCSSGLMTIYISKCQLEQSLFNTTSLSLFNYTGTECASKEYLVDGEPQVVFHDPIDSTKCGNNVTINTTHVIYSNVLYIYPAQGPILSRNNATVSLSCAYPLYFPVALNMTIRPIMGTTELSVPGVTGQVTINMVAYTDSSFTIPVSESTILYVENTIYIQVWMPDLEASKFSIKVIRLYATPGGTTAGNSPQTYNLTIGSDGCPNSEYGEGLLSLLQNGNSSLSRYAMKVFKITDQEYVNLYADVMICTPNCVVNCNQKIARASIPQNVASLNMELTAESNPFSGATDRFSMSWTLLSVISFLLFAKLM